MQNQREDWNMWNKLQAHNHAQNKFFTEDDDGLSFDGKAYLN